MGDRPLLFECTICGITGTLWTKMEMRRHVAIFHSAGVYSTISCGVCEGKFYDLQHFEEDHNTNNNNNNNTSSCCLSTRPYKMNFVPLPTHVEDAFLSLVDQMIRPVVNCATPAEMIGSEKSEEKTPSLEVIVVKQEVVEDPTEGDSSIGPTTGGGDAEDGTGMGGRRSASSAAAAAPSKMVIEKCQALLQQRYPQHGGDSDDRRIECGACGDDFQLLLLNNNNIASAIRHACAHSPKLFFQCQICDRKSLGPLAYRNHLRRGHRIPRLQQQRSLIDNSVQMPVEDGPMVDVVVDVFRRYFIDHPGTKKKPAAAAAAAKKTRTMREAALLLRAAGRKKTEARSTRVKLFGKLPREDQKRKAGHIRSKDGNVEDPNKVKQKHGRKGGSRRSLLVGECLKIVKRVQFDDHRTIRCRVCGATVKTQGGRDVTAVLSHACKHARRLQLNCQFCPFRAAHPYSLKHHLTVVHKCVQQPFVGLAELLVRAGSDLYQTFLRCFDDDDYAFGGNEEIPGKCGPKRELAAAASSKEEGDVVAANIEPSAVEPNENTDGAIEDNTVGDEIPKRGGIRLIGRKQIHALALIRKYAANHAASRFLTCKLCRKPVRVIWFGSAPGHYFTKYLVEHATRHTTDQCLYRCGVCGEERATWTALKDHSRKHHPHLPYSDTCVDRSQEFEDRIIEVMSACFDDPPKRRPRKVVHGRRPKPADTPQVRETEDETAGGALVFEEKGKLPYNCSK